MEHGGYTVLAGDEQDDGNLELPPGFRFHPTDEELITHYLSRKVADGGFVTRAIGDIDLNKIEPWDIPWRARMGEKEWYFFAVRDRKYPTGLRTNRATDAGYWKATGKDREIKRGGNLVGMKKTLVFYGGRAPKGEKTNWVMHEYRLDGKLSLCNIPKTAKNEWVICRVFQKCFSGGAGGVGKKVSAGLGRMGPSAYKDDMTMPDMAGNSSLLLPSTVDHTQYFGGGGGTFGGMARASQAASGAARVTCFSSTTPVEGQAGYIAADPLLSASANQSSQVSWPRPPAFLDYHLQCPNGRSQLVGDLRLSGPGPRGLGVQLLQGRHGYGVKGGCEAEEVGGTSLGRSQQTGLTSDMNHEISSPPADHISGRGGAHKLFFDALEVPSVPPLVDANLSMDDIWNYTS